MEAIQAIWAGTAPPPTGPTLAPHARVGRYTVPLDSPHEQGQPHLPTFGGSRRLVGDTPDEDLAIAALDGRSGGRRARGGLRALAGGSPGAGAVDAARFVRLAAATLDQDALLRRLAAKHPDPGVRWHAEDGLKTRSFERMADPVTRSYPGKASPDHPKDPPR